MSIWYTACSWTSHTCNYDHPSDKYVYVGLLNDMSELRVALQNLRGPVGICALPNPMCRNPHLALHETNSLYSGS